MPGQVEGGDAVLGLGEQIDAQEPDGQRQVGRGKERTGNNRGLAMALLALEQLSGGDGSILSASSVRTDEPIRPPQAKQRIPALLLGAV